MDLKKLFNKKPSAKKLYVPMSDHEIDEVVREMAEQHQVGLRTFDNEWQTPTPQLIVMCQADNKLEGGDPKESRRRAIRMGMGAISDSDDETQHRLAAYAGALVAEDIEAVGQVSGVMLIAEAKITKIDNPAKSTPPLDITQGEKPKRRKKAELPSVDEMLEGLKTIHARVLEGISVIVRTREGEHSFAVVPFHLNDSSKIIKVDTPEFTGVEEIRKTKAQQDGKVEDNSILAAFFEGYEFALQNGVKAAAKKYKIEGEGIITRREDLRRGGETWNVS